MNLFVPDSGASAMPSSQDERDLHERSDVELDLLPYGVICLDRTGTIVRYNRVEARFARLDRALVLGKQFFGVVAPCTTTPEFEGRFRTFVEDPNGPAQVSFPYVFNFRFGSQEVDVEIRRSRSPEHFYVCVGRRRFRSSALIATPGGEQRGVLLDELAPEEDAQGIVRDEVERRNVILDSTFFEALQATLDDAGAAQAMGLRWGARAARDLETEAAETFDRPLRRLPIKKALALVTGYLRRQGWGPLVVDLEHASAGLLAFHLERSVLAETSTAASTPSCGLIAGFLESVLSHLAQRPLVVREAHCRALGHASCLFVSSGASMRDTLLSAIATGSDVAGIARAVEAAR